MLRWSELVLAFLVRYGRTSLVAGDVAGRLTCRIDRCDQLMNGAYIGAGNEWAAKPFQGSGSEGHFLDLDLALSDAADARKIDKSRWHNKPAVS
jgi:hypothetical protein